MHIKHVFFFLNKCIQRLEGNIAITNSSKIWDMIIWVFVVYYSFEKYDFLKKNRVPQHDSTNIRKNKVLLEMVK